MPTLLHNVETKTFVVVDDTRVDEMVCAGKPDTQHERNNVAVGRFRVATPAEVRAYLDASPKPLPEDLFATDTRPVANEKMNPKKRPRYLVEVKQIPEGEPRPRPVPPKALTVEESASLREELEAMKAQLGALLRSKGKDKE